MADFSSHNFVLNLSDEQCELLMKLFGFDPIVSCKFESAGDLLSALLNRNYYPALVPLQQFQAMGTRTTAPDELPWRHIMDNWDHDKVYTIIRDIYHSGDSAINALPPSQRFRIYLAFREDIFTCEHVEQPFTYPHSFLGDDERSFNEFIDLSTTIKEEQNTTQSIELYKASCRIAQEKCLNIPRWEQYWFKTTQDIIMWLLRYVMEHDKHVKKCEHCGHYFVPKRSTKKYCSDKCATAQRSFDSFCGVQEARKLYKQIVVNLRDKDKRMEKLNKPYHILNKPGEAICPKEVLSKFYGDNAYYMTNLRDAFDALERADIPTPDLKDNFEQAKTAYIEWLQRQHKYVTSLRLDYDAHQ